MVIFNQPPPSAPERGHDGYDQPTTSIILLRKGGLMVMINQPPPSRSLWDLMVMINTPAGVTSKIQRVCNQPTTSILFPKGRNGNPEKMLTLSDSMILLLLFLPEAILFFLNGFILQRVLRITGKGKIIAASLVFSALIICFLPAILSLLQQNIFRANMPVFFPWTDCARLCDCPPPYVICDCTEPIACRIIHSLQYSNILGAIVISALIFMMPGTKEKKKQKKQVSRLRAVNKSRE